MTAFRSRWLRIRDSISYFNFQNLWALWIKYTIKAERRSAGIGVSDVGRDVHGGTIRELRVLNSRQLGYSGAVVGCVGGARGQPCKVVTSPTWARGYPESPLIPGACRADAGAKR